jgi:hypothetical protein
MEKDLEEVDELTEEKPEKKQIKISKKIEVKRPVQTVIEPESDSTDDEPPKKEYKKRPPKTEAQMEAWKKALATRALNNKKKKEEAEAIARQSQKELEDQVVKKAIAIKKKQIKAKAKLDEVLSDDDTPIEVVRQVAKKAVAKQTAKPVFTFV